MYLLVGRQAGADGGADLADAGDLADVLAFERVAGGFESGADGQLLVLVGELDDAQPHPAAGPVDADDRPAHE